MRGFNYNDWPQRIGAFAGVALLGLFLIIYNNRYIGWGGMVEQLPVLGIGLALFAFFLIFGGEPKVRERTPDSRGATGGAGGASGRVSGGGPGGVDSDGAAGDGGD